MQPTASSVILTKVRIQSHVRQRWLPWILTFVRMTERRCKVQAPVPPQIPHAILLQHCPRYFFGRKLLNASISQRAPDRIRIASRPLQICPSGPGRR